MMLRPNLSSFGFTQLRPAQQEVVDSLLKHQDTIAILPTGLGKSLCYQLTGLSLPHVTVVVSPLLALMSDQVEGLRKRGLPAASLNSLTPWPVAQQIQRQLLTGQLKFLYLSPEKLLSPGTTKLLQKVRISQLAVDEAHCISHWGADFRPPYRQVGQWWQDYAQHQTKPLLSAFTATATWQCLQDMQTYLSLNQPIIVSRAPFRPNLRYHVFNVPSEGWKRQMILFFLQFCKDSLPGGTLIYAATRLDVQWLAWWLQDHGFPHARYFHAGLSPEEKSAAFSYFHHHECPIMVTTNAFGMGVDFPHVRFVLHHSPPTSLDDYVQEAGRAGRDGQTAYPVLLNLEGDLEKNYELGLASGSTDQKAVLQQKTTAMYRYLNRKRCYQQQIMEYFKLPGMPLAPYQECRCGRCTKNVPWQKYRLTAVSK